MKTAYIGDVGEAEVLLALLEMGAAVNLITGADYGWDLHVQVPLTPTSVSTFQGDAGWPMSGRSAHIQVKNKSGSLSPSANPGSVRGWLTGSETGVPTFVCVVVPGRKLYFSPKDLQVLLGNWEENNKKRREGGKKDTKSVTLRLSSARHFEPEQFSWILHLWSKYPGVMMRSSIQEWPSISGDELSSEMSKFVHQIVLAWLKSHFSDIYVGDGTKGLLKRRPGTRAPDRSGSIDFVEQIQGADALAIAQAAFLTMHSGKTADAEEAQNFSWSVLRSIGESIEKCGYRWPKADFMTSYASSPDIGRSREEAIELVKDVAEFHNRCQLWAPDK